MWEFKGGFKVSLYIFLLKTRISPFFKLFNLELAKFDIKLCMMASMEILKTDVSGNLRPTQIKTISINTHCCSILIVLF